MWYELEESGTVTRRKRCGPVADVAVKLHEAGSEIVRSLYHRGFHLIGEFQMVGGLDCKAVRENWEPLDHPKEVPTTGLVTPLSESKGSLLDSRTSREEMDTKILMDALG
jgi:hypothetical protein